jgi:hypothetical protein
LDIFKQAARRKAAQFMTGEMESMAKSLKRKKGGGGERRVKEVPPSAKIVQSGEVIVRYDLQGARVKKTRTLYCSSIVGKTAEEARLIAQEFAEGELTRIHRGREVSNVKVTNL